MNIFSHKYLLLLLLLTLTLVSCQNKDSVPQSLEAPKESKVKIPKAPVQKVWVPKGPYDHLTPETLEAGAAYCENNTGHTIISKVSMDTAYRTSYMIISKDGRVIVVDPYMAIPGIKADIITSSHHDYDHKDDRLNAYNPDSKIIKWTMESFTKKDIKVTAIASTHYDYIIDPINPSNVIYLFEVDGLRIAAMGDICQDRFTDEQLTALGHIDVVFIMMEAADDYGFSSVNTTTMLKQLKPTIAFPTHQSVSVLEDVAKLFDTRLDTDYRYEITEEDIAGETSKLIILADIKKE